MTASTYRILVLLLVAFVSACGGDSRVTGNEVVVDPEPVVRNLEGRAVKGVIRHGVLEAHEFSGGLWQLLSVGFTDADGFFNIDLTGVANPVRISVTADVNTRILCDALSGCGEVAFGGETLPPENFRLVTILPSDYAGEAIAVTPLTHLAARWIESMPAGLPLTDSVINLANARVADLFGLEAGFISQLPVDLTDATEISGAASMLHSILGASFSSIAYGNSIDLQVLLEAYASEFAGQAGQLMLATDYTEMRPGLDLIQLVSNSIVQTLIDEASRDALLASIDNLVSRWGENPLSAAGGAYEYDQQDFDSAMVLLDDLDYYLNVAGIDESASFLSVQMDQFNWLYHDELSRADTVGLVRVITENIIFAVLGSLSENIIGQMTAEEQPALGNCIDLSGVAQLEGLLLEQGYAIYCREEQVLTVSGSRHGQQVNVVIDVASLALDVPMNYTLRGVEPESPAQVSNATAAGELQGNLSIVLSGIDPDQPIDIAAVSVAVELQGSGSIVRVSEQAGHPVAVGDGFIASLQAGGSLNLGAIASGGAVLTVEVVDGVLQTPFGDQLFALDSAFCQGRAALLVEVGELSSLETCFAFEAFGLPEMQLTAAGELAGLFDLIGQVLAGIETSPDDLAAVTDGLDPSVLSLLGGATLNILDAERGQRSYEFVLENNRLDAVRSGTDHSLSFYLTSLNGGYIVSGSTLVATVNSEWQSLGATLVLANGEQRSYLLGPVSDVADDSLVALLLQAFSGIMETLGAISL